MLALCSVSGPGHGTSWGSSFTSLFQLFTCENQSLKDSLKLKLNVKLLLKPHLSVKMKPCKPLVVSHYQLLIFPKELITSY